MFRDSKSEFSGKSDEIVGKSNCRHSDSSSSPSLILWEDPRTRGLLRVTSRSACLFPREMWFIDHEYTQDFIEVAKIIDTPVLTHYSILGKHNSSKVRMCTHFNASVYPVHPRCQGHNKSLVTHTYSLNSAISRHLPNTQHYFSALPPIPQLTCRLTHSANDTMGFWPLIKCCFTCTVNTDTHLCTTAAVSSKSPNTYSMSYHKHYNLSSVAAMAKLSGFRGGSDTGQETMEYFLPQTLLHGKIQWIQRRF